MQLAAWLLESMLHSIFKLLLKWHITGGFRKHLAYLVAGILQLIGLSPLKAANQKISFTAMVIAYFAIFSALYLLSAASLWIAKLVYWFDLLSLPKLLLFLSTAIAAYVYLKGKQLLTTITLNGGISDDKH